MTRELKLRRFNIFCALQLSLSLKTLHFCVSSHECLRMLLLESCKFVRLVTPLETLSLHFSSAPSPTLPRDEAAALALALPSLPLLHGYPPSAPRHRSLGRLERRNCIPFLLPTLHFYRERGALQGAPSDRARHPRGHASHPKRGTETEAK